MERAKTVKPLDKSVEKWIAEGYVPRYMIPAKYTWYDCFAIDDATGVEYAKVGDKSDAQEFYEDYLAEPVAS